MLMVALVQKHDLLCVVSMMWTRSWATWKQRHQPPADFQDPCCSLFPPTCDGELGLQMLALPSFKAYLKNENYG